MTLFCHPEGTPEGSMEGALYEILRWAQNDC